MVHKRKNMADSLVKESTLVDSSSKNKNGYRSIKRSIVIVNDVVIMLSAKLTLTYK